MEGDLKKAAMRVDLDDCIENNNDVGHSELFFWFFQQKIKHIGGIGTRNDDDEYLGVHSA